MECNQMKPAEMRETVQMLWRVRSAQELDNRNMEKRVRQMFGVVEKCNQKKIAEPAASQYIDAFLSGNPSKAYRNLVELRSGRSLSDQRDPPRQTPVPVDLENKKSPFSFLYRNFNSTFMNTMSGRSVVCSRYRSGGCVEAALRELSTTDFRQQRDRSPAESPTATSIVTHLALLYNSSIELSLKEQRRAEQKKVSYFPIIKEFALSRSVPFIY